MKSPGFPSIYLLMKSPVLQRALCSSHPGSCHDTFLQPREFLRVAPKGGEDSHVWSEFSYVYGCHKNQLQINTSPIDSVMGLKETYISYIKNDVISKFGPCVFNGGHMLHIKL